MTAISSSKAKVPVQDLAVFVKEAMFVFGSEVNCDRAVIDYRDGLKPVARRLLWSGYRLALGDKVKAARLVGDTMGRLHPHGDCLRGNTRIPLLNGKTTTIKDLVEAGAGKKWVLSWDKNTERYVPALAYAWRVGQTTQEMYRVTLTNGEYFEVTGNHPFFTETGEVPARELQAGHALIGGQLTNTLYRKVCLSSDSILLHRLVGESRLGALDDSEVYHHSNGDSQDNRPSNLEVRSRAEHAYEHIENALVGLDAGRETMFNGSSKMRKAIREKNSRLLSEYNRWLPVIKAFKAVAILKVEGGVTGEAYEALRKSGRLYNLTRLSTLARYGYSLDRILKEGEFRLDTSSAVGLTPKKRRQARMKYQKGQEFPAWLLKQVSIVLRSLLSALPVEELTWPLVERKAKQLAAPSNHHKLIYTSAARLRKKFGVTTPQELVRKFSSQYLRIVEKVTRVVLKEPEDFYDFTVDGYENMIVCPADKNSTTFVVVHNSSIYGALVTQVNSPVNTFTGIGNWGTLIDGPAAMRYTEARLSPYGKTFLAANYTPVMDKVWNYDKKEMEPLCLPALLPNVLFNGTNGIGVGINSVLPSFTPASLLGVMVRLLDGEKLTPMDYVKSLEFFDPWGAKAVLKGKANTERVLAMMTSPSGSVLMTSPLRVEREAKRIIMENFTPGVRLETIPAKKGSNKPPRYGLIDNIKLLPERPDVTSIRKGFGYIIQAKKSLNFAEFDRLVEKIQKMATTSVSFNINVTERTPTENGNYEVGFMSLSIPQLIQKWLIFRIKLERASLEVRVQNQKAAIAYTKLLIYACDHLEVIFKSLRTADPRAYLVKHLRITEAQADQILDLKVRQLSKLDQDALKEKLKEQIAQLKDLERRLKQPKVEVRNFLARCATLFVLERAKMGHHHWQLKPPSKAAAQTQETEEV